MIWWRAVEREWGVPTFVLDTPLVATDSVGINLVYVRATPCPITAADIFQIGRRYELLGFPGCASTSSGVSSNL